MMLPDHSNCMSVGWKRYIQSVREPSERRNPDSLVRIFFPLWQRWRSAWFGRQELAELRASPFYYFLVARTRHYDAVFTDAVEAGVRLIVNIGCGSDTRAHRFVSLLRGRGVRVLECDFPDLIEAKREAVKRWRAEHVDYLPLDLNAGEWPALAMRFREPGSVKTLVLMEGVSHYIEKIAFERFLAFLGDALPGGSIVAYDFKLRGVDDAFGRTDRARTPFRLPPAPDVVAAFHGDRGLRLDRMVLSADLTARLLPGLEPPPRGMFTEDGLITLTAARAG